MSRAVSSGKGLPSLSNRSPGMMSTSRWLTTLNRILRLPVSTVESTEHSLPVEYVMKVCAPFEIMKIRGYSWSTSPAKNESRKSHSFQMILVYRSRGYSEEYLFSSLWKYSGGSAVIWTVKVLRTRSQKNTESKKIWVERENTPM